MAEIYISLFRFKCLLTLINRKPNTVVSFIYQVEFKEDIIEVESRLFVMPYLPTITS